MLDHARILFAMEYYNHPQ